MAKDDRDIVSELRRLLADRVGPERYELWFGARVRFEIDGTRILVSLADTFLLDRLRNHFSRDIEAVGALVVGSPVTLEYRHDPRIARAEAARSTRDGGDGERGDGERGDGERGDGERGDGDSDVPIVTVDRGPTRGRGVARGARSRRFPRRPLATLADFVEGPDNRVAYAAAVTVIERPGRTSPLYLYGPTGCGKSHLLEGICSCMRGGSGAGHCVCVSAEQFTSDFLEALHGGGLPSFRRKYRDVEVLLIDDVQFFAGKRATLVEMHHTMDAFLREGRQMVLSADRAPAALTGISPEMSARMAGGLICGIEPPGFATRLEIVRRYGERRGVSLPEDVLETVAAEIDGDARQLHGAVNRLQATGKAHRLEITADLARAALGDLSRCTRRAVQLSDIDRVVCDAFGLEPKSLRGDGKTKSISQPRALAMWLARKYTRAAYSEIGSFFGRRSHSTVISAQKKVNLWVAGGVSIRMSNGDCQVEDALRRVESQLRTG